MSRAVQAWRLTPGLILHYREWEGEFALYNNLSGDTHLLAAPAIHILETLRHTPLPYPDLAAALAQEFELDADAGLDEELDQLLASLRHLFLIEPA